MSERTRRWAAASTQRSGMRQLAQDFVRRHGAEVNGGPFRGLSYPPEMLARVNCQIPKLLGAYEHELEHVMREGVARAPSIFVDLGCAEGYYAVGFALASPRTIVHAFDVAVSARGECARLAAWNNVDHRVVVHGRARGRDIRSLARGSSAVVLCDVEGAETEVFDRRTVASLASALVVIELHEVARPGVAATVPERFATTHSLELLRATPRDESAVPELGYLDPPGRRVALSEFRNDGTAWAVLRPRS